MADAWVLPGRPLPDGAGWRLWCANRPGGSSPRIEIRDPVTALLVDHTVSRVPIASPAGFARQIELLDVRLAVPQPGRSFRIAVPELALAATWSTSVSSLPAEGLSVLLGSCFYVEDDKTGHYERAVATLLARDAPRAAFRILMGDQLYLDWPAQGGSDAAPATARRYTEYWGNDAFRRAMFACPNFVVCDDHEFWNNYPEFQVHLSRTHTDARRREWGTLAGDYLDAFQLALNRTDPRVSTRTQPWVQLDIAPVSFFLLDSRSQRLHHDGSIADGRLLGAAQEAALRAWQRGLKGPGFLVLGQPMLMADGDWRDYSISNFRRECDALMQIVEDSLRGENDDGRPHDIVMVSGDIHTARHVRACVQGVTDRMLHELITSPLSRVGPFVSSPDPELPCARLTGTRVANGTTAPMSWDVSPTAGTRFAHVDNNIAVLTLHRRAMNTYSVDARFRVFRVRPARQPFWKFWADDAANAVADPSSMLLYDTTLHLE